jgi:hypothetical protein
VHGVELKGVPEDEGPPGPPPEHDASDEVAAGDERPIRCAACLAAVTHESARVSVHGAHEHRRVNPSGVDFHVGCFSEAPGCAGEGTPTRFWTWFPGYAWRVALCRGCGAHLGWEFFGEGSFWGLVLTRLRYPSEG